MYVTFYLNFSCCFIVLSHEQTAFEKARPLKTGRIMNEGFSIL